VTTYCEGVLKRILKPSVRPIEIGRKLIRAIKTGQSVGADGRKLAPNHFAIYLNESDREAFGDLEKALISELTDAARQYCQDEQLTLVGALNVSLVTQPSSKPGEIEVQAEIRANAAADVASSEAPPSPAPQAQPPAPRVAVTPVTPPTVATPSIPSVPIPAAAPLEKRAVLVLGDGTRVAVKLGVMSIGRSAESSLPLNDTNVSRRHAEIRSRGEGVRSEWFLRDVGSTNGTMLNGVKISGDQKLKNGDALMFGGTSVRFEVS